MDETTPTDSHHPESALRITLGVGHSMGLDMYNDMYPSLQHHTKQFYCPENPLFHHTSQKPTYVLTVHPPAFIAGEWNAKKEAQNRTPNPWF